MKSLLSIDDRAKEQLAKKAERAGFDPEVFYQDYRRTGLGTKEKRYRTRGLRAMRNFVFREYSAFTAHLKTGKIEIEMTSDIYPSDMTEYSGFMSEYFERIVKVGAIKGDKEHFYWFSGRVSPSCCW